MFYERFLQICDQNHEKPTQVLKTIGASPGNLGNWKSGGAVKSDTLMKLSEHFNVSVDYLLGLTDNSMSNNIIIGHGNSGTATVNSKIQNDNNAIVEIETIISKLTGASRYRAIADVLEVLEKYA